MSEDALGKTDGLVASSSEAEPAIRFAHPKWKPVHGLLLIAIGIFAFANSFDVPFLFDDQTAIQDSPYIRSLWPLDRAMSALPQSTGAGRPILNLSLAINYHFGGLRVWGYHAVNLGIHLAVGLLLYGFIRRTLQLRAMIARFGSASHELAFAATLLWLVHPIQTESVTYIVQRAESIAAMFYVGTLYAFLRGATGGGLAWLFVAVGSCAIGMASKETLVTAPLMVLLFDRFFVSGSFRGAIAGRKAFYAGLGATWLILAAIMSTGPRSATVGFGADLPSPWSYALGQFEVIVHYLKLVFWPSRLCLDYGWPVPASIGQVAVPMTLIVLLLALTTWGFRRRSPWAFAACWLFIILSPTSSFVPIADLAFEHRMYLPMAGITTIAVCTLYFLSIRIKANQAGEMAAHAKVRLPGRQAMAVFAWVVLCAAAATLTWRTRLRNETYRSEVAIWNDVLEQRPENSRAIYNLAWARFKRGDLDSAEVGLRRAIEISPEYASPRALLGILLSNEGRHDEGVVEAQHAAEFEPTKAENFYNVALILSRMGRDDEAARVYRRAIDLRPDYAEAWYNLGNIDIRAKRFPEAAEHFARAIEFDPLSVGARFNLSGLLLQMGRHEEAGRLIEQTLAIARSAAVEARREGRLRDAAEMQGKVVQILPDHADERLILARDLAAEGEIDAALGQCDKAASLGSQSKARVVRDEIEQMR